ncbi:MAG TPA: GDP-mannose 4,6-dehydratase [Woeseiaceae bacterium]|nr:GDP-mannose 4,6-dehydratase [Woeseiaceae bacterium]
MKKALLTGISGQDGAYLSKLLISKGYKVYGAYRRTSDLNTWRLDELGIGGEVEFIPLDLLEFSNILRVVEKVGADEVYNLAAQSFVGVSFDQPIYTSNANGLGVVRMLEAVRVSTPDAKFYQASTSEMFGKVQQTPQNETTPFYPRSPYGVAKLYAHWMTINYRESYGMKACCGILFNHESPLRGLEFVTRKVTAGIARIAAGSQEILTLGNIDASRDWGFAGDYVEGMWRMLQQKDFDDYVLATGVTHTVREMIEVASAVVGIDIEWQGSDVDERGIDSKTGKQVIGISPQFYRPAEVDLLLGDAQKAKKELDWVPTMSFETLVEEMVAADVRRFGSNSNCEPVQRF